MGQSDSDQEDGPGHLVVLPYSVNFRCSMIVFTGIPLRFIEVAWGLAPGYIHVLCLKISCHGPEQARVDQETERGHEEDRPGFLGDGVWKREGRCGG